MSMFRMFFAAVLVCGLMLASGCKPTLDIPIGELSFDGTQDSGTITIGASGRGNLNWSVSSDVDWISFSETSGTGEATIDVEIDRSKLPPLSISRGTITIQSSGGNHSIEVVVPSPIAGLDPAYLPLAEGNVWDFVLPVDEPEVEGKLAQAVLKGVGGEDGSIALRMEVVEEQTVNSVTVWTIEAGLPDADVPIVDECGSVIDTRLELKTYWVNLGGIWFITLDESRLEALPNVEGWIPFVSLVKLPAQALYLLLSDRLEQLGEDIADVFANADAELESDPDLQADYEAMLDSLRANLDSDAFREVNLAEVEALLAAFAAEFDDYSSDNELLADVIRLVAALAASAEPIGGFVNEAQEILEATGDALDEVPVSALDELRNVVEELLYYGFYDANFDGSLSFEETEGSGMTQAQFDAVDDNGDDLLSDEELEAALDDIQDQRLDQLLAIAQAFADRYAAFTSPDALLQATVRLLAVLAEEAARLIELEDGYTVEDQEAIEEFNADITDFLNPEEECDPAFKLLYGAKALDYKLVFGAAGEFALLVEPEDVDELIAFINDYESENDAVNDVRQAYLAVLPLVRDLVVVAEDYDVTEFAMANLKALSADLATFTEQFATANAGNSFAAPLAIIAAGVDEVVAELVILEPALEEIVAELELLLVDLDNPTEDVFDPATYEEAFGDLATFFEGFNEENDHPIAAVAAIRTRALEDVATLFVELKEELDAIEYVEKQGSLSELLQDGFPEALEYEVDDFGVGEQEDCLSAGVIIPEPEEEEEADKQSVTHEVTMAIFGRDLGPVMLGPLTLFEATIDGETIGGAGE